MLLVSASSTLLTALLEGSSGTRQHNYTHKLDTRRDSIPISLRGSTLQRHRLLRDVTSHAQSSRWKLLTCSGRTRALNISDQAAMGRAPNSATAEAGQSRSGLLVAQQMLHDKLQGDAPVCCLVEA